VSTPRLRRDPQALINLNGSASRRMINATNLVPSPSPTTSNQPTPTASRFSHRGPTSPVMDSPSIPPPSPFLPQQGSTFLSTRFPLLSRSGAGTGGLSAQASSMTLSSSVSQSLSSGPWVGVTSTSSKDTVTGGIRRGLGYLWPEAGLVLGLEDLVGLVEDCCRELRERGGYFRPQPYNEGR
jgi:hypothetical protein